MDNIIDILNDDKDLQALKKQYEEKYMKNAPPFNTDEYNGIDDYKEQLKKLVEG